MRSAGGRRGTLADPKEVAVIGNDVAFQQTRGFVVRDDDVADVVPLIEEPAGVGKPSTLQPNQGGFYVGFDVFCLGFVFEPEAGM